MTNPVLRRLPALMAGCAFSLANASCATEEVQLDSMYVYLSADDPMLISGPESGATCLTMMNLIEDAPSYEVRLNGQPLVSNPSEPEVVTTRSTEMFCVGAGDFNFSLVARGKTVAQTGVTSMRAGSQHVVRIRGDRRAPSVTLEEIDMSSPGPGRRRMRVTNLLKERQPVEVYFYDDRKEPQASTGVIAYGDTYEGSIPVDLYLWRSSLDEETALEQGFIAGAGRSNPLDYLCMEKPPAGLVLLGLPETQGAVTFYHMRQEFYLQRPLTCTVDKSQCKPPCAFQGW